MDFIERLLNVAPDGGNGGYELLLMVMPFVLAYAVWRRRARRP